MKSTADGSTHLTMDFSPLIFLLFPTSMTGFFGYDQRSVSERRLVFMELRRSSIDSSNVEG